MIDKILKKEKIKKRDGYIYYYHTSCYNDNYDEIVGLSIFEGKESPHRDDELIKYVTLVIYSNFVKTIEGIFSRRPIWQLPKNVQKDFYGEIVADYIENDGKNADEILDKFNPWVLRG